jgi:thioredoxin 1
VRAVTDETFETEVLRASRPIVVDFWAPWCGPCKAVEPVLEQLQADHPEIEVVRLDIDENVATAGSYSVLSIPTVVLFEGGLPRETLVGARPKAHYQKAFARWLAAPAA